MPEYLYPGVYVEEIDTGNKPIEGVSTSTVGFLGVAERGPTTATFLSSFPDYVRAFGSYYQTPSRQFYLTHSVEGFFQNGGKRCYVQRVLPAGGIAATYSDSKIEITAIGEGDWGNRIGIKVENNQAGNAVRLTVMYWPQLPPTPIQDPTSSDINVRRASVSPQLIEVFDDLVDDPSSSNFYELQINEISNLITVKRVATGLPDQVGSPNPQVLSGGQEGSNPLALGDFQGNPADPPGQKHGLDAFTEIDDISLLCCPDSYALDDNSAKAINEDLINQCETLKDRFAVISSRPREARPGTLTIDYNSKYAAFYYPWMYVINPISGQKVLIPPGGHVVGIYGRSDTIVGVHKDPANEVIRGIDSLQFVLTDQQQSQLNPIGINALRYFKGAGNLVWGGRTTTRDPDWKYINVRRLFIFVEKSIQRATQWVVFEINDEPLWARVRRSISDFLTRMWLDGMLQGAKKEEAFFVKCDRTTMTQADIDNGRLICVIGIAPVKPAEFVIFRIGQWYGGSEAALRPQV
jgi:phage tail sheath protein FI